MQHAHEIDTNVLGYEYYKDSFIIAQPTEEQAE